jgi:hypothetical protein
MQRVKNARDQLNSRTQWIQLGLLAASILAPLMRRWNELRAMEHTRATPEDAAPPASEPKSDTVPSRHMIPLSSTIFWVVGVGVGIIAAGFGTYLFLKRRMVAYREEPLVPLPFLRPDRAAIPSSQLAGSNHGPRSDTTTSSGSGDQLPLAMRLETAVLASDPGPGNTDAEWITSEEDAPGEPDIDVAAVVGNIRTLAYHFTDDANLPDVDNRVYFSSEEEARLAGFHHVTEETTTSENSAVE